VRSPGATDGPRLLLIGLSALSVVLLIWATALVLAPRVGAGRPEIFWIAATVSIVTHILALLRIWARR